MQFPQHNVVSILEHSSSILRFKITTTTLENTVIMYGINGSIEKYYPMRSFDYRAMHSAIIVQCNLNTTYNCSELYIRVEGKPEMHNTSFHLVLIEMVHPQFYRKINIFNNFTVFIITGMYSYLQNYH